MSARSSLLHPDSTHPPRRKTDLVAALTIERGEQRNRAAAFVVVGAPIDLAVTQRQQRLCAVEGLDLIFLVNAEKQGALGRAEVEADDVAHLVDERRIGR